MKTFTNLRKVKRHILAIMLMFLACHQVLVLIKLHSEELLPDYSSSNYCLLTPFTNTIILSPFYTQKVHIVCNNHCKGHNELMKICILRDIIITVHCKDDTQAFCMYIFFDFRVGQHIFSIYC